VEIDILKIRRRYIYFLKGHADTISRITIPPNQGDVIACEKDPEAFREGKGKHTRV
jgi:hypothetical protein